MLIPCLDRIIEAHVPIARTGYSGFVNQLRSDVLPSIRHLQAEGLLRWYCVLQHPKQQLLHPEVADADYVFHLRLEAAQGVELEEFISGLPSHFVGPVSCRLGPITGGLSRDRLVRQSWAQAWGIVGASSEWLLCLLEAHAGEVPLEHVIQALHYALNPVFPKHEFAHVGTMQRF